MAIGTLIATNVKAWLSARGFWMVVAAALLPLLLTGAWIATHQKDVAVESVTWQPQTPTAGQSVNFTAVIKNNGRFDVAGFNVTFRVGHVTAAGNTVQFVADASNATRVDFLGAGERKEVRLNWEAEPGIYVVWAATDTGNELAEIEEFNNDKLNAFEAFNREASQAEAPRAPGNLTNPSASTTSDIVVENLRWTPDLLATGKTGNFTVTVRNAGPDAASNVNVSIRIGQMFSGRMFPFQQLTPPRTLNLAAGESTDVTLTWNNLPAGSYWAEAFANATASRDSNVTNNYVNRSLTVDDRLDEGFKFPEPEEKATIKRFYLDILISIMVPLVLPFIGLFYGGGVIEDERSRGNLLYILTRPVPRPLLPLLKFAVNFVVAAIAVLIGVTATFFLLLGTPEGNVGFLTTPLLVALLTLFCYGAFFTLLGVTVDRPYIVGIAFVAWEWLVAVGQLILINNNPLVAPWVKNITLSHHLIKATEGWPLNEGLVWFPPGAALKELQVLLGAAVVFLILAAIVMKRREFEL